MLTQIRKAVMRSGKGDRQGTGARIISEQNRYELRKA